MLSPYSRDSRSRHYGNDGVSNTAGMTFSSLWCYCNDSQTYHLSSPPCCFNRRSCALLSPYLRDSRSRHCGNDVYSHRGNDGVSNTTGMTFIHTAGMALLPLKNNLVHLLILLLNRTALMLVSTLLYALRLAQLLWFG